MGVEYGTIINEDSESVVKKSGPVAAGVNLGIGLVYLDDANGWKNAPTNGSIIASRLYFNPVALDNTNGVKGDKTGTFYGLNAQVVGKIEGTMALNSKCKASGTTAQAFAALTIRTDTVVNNQADNDAHVAGYLGHVGEIKSKDSLATAGANNETNGVFVMLGGYA